MNTYPLPVPHARPDAHKSTATWRALLCMVGMLLLMLGGLPSCVSAPQGVTPVTGFDVKRYEGTWYEIARLNHPFERGLTHVTAMYSESPDGGLLVLNRGYDMKARKWKSVHGTAQPLADPQVASLKVKVATPFYAGYHVVALDKKGYRYALVAGPSRKYLWILSRTPEMDVRTLELLKAKARELGYDTNELIMVSQGGIPEVEATEGR